MAAARFSQVLEEAEACIGAGDLDGAESHLIDLLHEVRGVDAGSVYTEALDMLAAVYGRSGRVFESLILSRLLVEHAVRAGSAYREARALVGVCIGRYGLYIGADLTEDLWRVRELAREIEVGTDTLGFHLEHAYVEFGHALDRGDLDGAHASLDRFHELAALGPKDKRLALCVELGNRARIAHCEGDPAAALSLLDEIESRGVSDPYHAPELQVLRLQARIALGDLGAARADAVAALDAIETAPDSAFSDCIHYGAELADALADGLSDVAGARRAYDAVATAVVRRIKQVDACMVQLPELGLGARHEADLIRYRRAFVSEQRALLKRVADMFRGANLAQLRELLQVDEQSGYVAVCAWCESVRADDGRWIGVGHLLPREGPFLITHGICPPCVRGLAAGA